MRHFVAWPAFNIQKSNATAREWARMGWKVAVAIDASIPELALHPQNVTCHIPPLRIKEWKGYYDCMAHLVRQLATLYAADIVACAAEGVLPDPQARAVVVGAAFATKFPNGFGCLQPTADPWRPEQSGDSANEIAKGRRMHATPSTLERCESPILGRPFIMEAYGGKGPWAEKYRQYFGDVELHDVASRMGVMWKNPQLLHKREHWSRFGGTMQPYQARNFDKWYEKDFAMYRARKYKDFPGSERKSKLLLPGNGIVMP